MSMLKAAMAARAFHAGHGLRISTLRHRRLKRDALVLVLWQLGAEPFSPAAIGWGTGADFELAVPGEPRNRDRLFTALLPFAKSFNPWFEQYRGEETEAPQVIVANQATVELMGRLGRRLMYLKTEGDSAVDPQLPRLGRYLRFLYDRSATPGQQLVLSMTELLQQHWAVALSQQEQCSLAAMDAFIEPPQGKHGFDAAAAAEHQVVGPLPDGESDGKVEPLMARFLAGDATAYPEITEHYRVMVDATWQLIRKCRDRELLLDEAPSVERRWTDDCKAYRRYQSWIESGGHSSSRSSARSATWKLLFLEKAEQLLEAEEACDDPFRMIPYLLCNKAVQGTVTAIDTNHQEQGPKRKVKRPLVTIEVNGPCLIPIGKELRWTRQSNQTGYEVHAIEELQDGDSSVTLKLLTSQGSHLIPEIGTVACFSIFSTKSPYSGEMTSTEPWTHQSSKPVAVPQPIEVTAQ